MAPPRPPPALRRVPGRGGNACATALWEWPAVGAVPGATVVLVHATGFHSRCWDEVVRCLPETFRCICVDAPGHGLSDAPREPEVNWRAFARRLHDALADAGVRLGEVSVLAGHSMGGFLCTLLAAAEAVPALLLVDPVIFPQATYEQADSLESQARTEKMHRNTLQRKAAFSNPDEMFERFKDRMPYAAWCPQVLHDYCEHGLGTRGHDGLRPLLCTPAVEAGCYVAGSSRATDPSFELQLLTARQQRCVVLRAGHDPQGRPFVGSPTDPTLASRLGTGAGDVLLEGATHFIPMTHPALVARHIEELARTQARL